MSAFRHCAGSILWGSHPLTPGEIDRMGDLFAAEIGRACDAGDAVSADAAVRLACELTKAMRARAAWRRASRPYAIH